MLFGLVAQPSYTEPALPGECLSHANRSCCALLHAPPIAVKKSAVREEAQSHGASTIFRAPAQK